MSNYTATVIKTGNSYALRVPKEYAQEANITLGDKVLLPLPTVIKKQDRKKIVEAIKRLREINAFSSIKDPVAWQREIRKDRPLPGRE